MKSIVILSSGSLATNPRLVKEANALHAHGFHVEVLYSYAVEWAEGIDKDIIQQSPWPAKLIGGSPSQNWFIYHWSRWLFRIIHRTRNPAFRTTRLTRTSRLLSRAAKAKKADLYIAHNLGALYAAVSAANRHHALAAFDAEDYHSGEFAQGSWDETLHQLVEKQYLPHCAQTWSASPLISKAYQSRFPELAFHKIDNVFPLKRQRPFREDTTQQVKFIWFSQTIGKGRGLEAIFDAFATQSENSWALTLIGQVSDDMKIDLVAFQTAYPNQVRLLDPISEEELFEELSQHDIGLALEIGIPENRNLCRTNKLFSYILSGCYVLMTDTQAQLEFHSAYPESATLLPLQASENWAAITRDLINRTEHLLHGRKANWKLGRSRLNWDIEQLKLRGIVEAMINSPAGKA